MVNKRLKLLAIFAHPDDAELSCGGTIARLNNEGYQIYVLLLTSGKNDVTNRDNARISEALAASQILGYELRIENLKDGFLTFDAKTIKIIDDHINKLSPQIIITHYPQELGQGHQDHLAISSAAVNSALRHNCVKWILYAEPPLLNSDFMPNFFVDITEYIILKKEALAEHKTQQKKSYMKPNIIETKASWWAIQADINYNSNTPKFYEAFLIIKGIFDTKSYL